MIVTATAAITSAHVWALIAGAGALATMATAGARLLVPARARRLPAPASLAAITVSAALIWLALQRRFPDDAGAAETALYTGSFIAAAVATVLLAITTDEAGLSIRTRNRRHTVGLFLLSAATIGLLIALTDAYIT